MDTIQRNKHYSPLSYTMDIFSLGLDINKLMDKETDRQIDKKIGDYLHLLCLGV